MVGYKQLSEKNLERRPKSPAWLFVEKLKTMRKYAEAAILLETYAKQPEEAITTLIEGALWDESLRLVSQCASYEQYFG